jgi:hypothetical protein
LARLHRCLAADNDVGSIRKVRIVGIIWECHITVTRSRYWPQMSSTSEADDLCSLPVPIVVCISCPDKGIVLHLDYGRLPEEDDK